LSAKSKKNKFLNATCVRAQYANGLEDESDIPLKRTPNYNLYTCKG